MDDSDADLIDRKTEEHYLSERNAGDEDYAITVLIPCLAGNRICQLSCSC